MGKATATRLTKDDESAMSFMRYILRGIKARSRKKEIKSNMSMKYLLGLWDGQGGLCNMTGLPMDMSYDLSSRMCTGPNRLFYPSLDRIDSEKGYVRGNVQWVCMGINYMKNSCTDEQALEFLTALL